jgi:hypothetical protein
VHLYFGSMHRKRVGLRDSNRASWLGVQADITMTGSQPHPQFQVHGAIKNIQRDIQGPSPSSLLPPPHTDSLLSFDTYFRPVAPTSCALQRHNNENSKQKYSQKRNCAASVPNLRSCVCERFIYNRSAYSAAGKYVDRSWEYINCSQTHESGNWAAKFLFWDYINGIFAAVGGSI